MFTQIYYIYFHNLDDNFSNCAFISYLTCHSWKHGIFKKRIFMYLEKVGKNFLVYLHKFLKHLLCSYSCYSIAGDILCAQWKKTDLKWICINPNKRVSANTLLTCEVLWDGRLTWLRFWDNFGGGWGESELEKNFLDRSENLDLFQYQDSEYPNQDLTVKKRWKFERFFCCYIKKSIKRDYWINWKRENPTFSKFLIKEQTLF